MKYCIANGLTDHLLGGWLFLVELRQRFLTHFQNLGALLIRRRPLLVHDCRGGGGHHDRRQCKHYANFHCPLPIHVDCSFVVNSLIFTRAAA
jgi:hypothetical protein